MATTTRTGRIEHRIVGGVEAGLSTADSDIGIGQAAPLDIFNPVYPPEPEPSVPTHALRRHAAGRVRMDQVRLAIESSCSGLRWSELDIENRVATTGEPRSSQSVVSPSLGLIVLPRPWLSIYTTYAQGFAPPAPGQYLEDGRAWRRPRTNARRRSQGRFGSQRFSVTAAGFRIRRTNVPEADVQGFYRQIGEAESHGLEVEAVGSVARGLAMRGGYSWTSTEITRDTSGFVGRELPNAPRHKAEMWARYRITQGALKTLMVAGGVVHISDRFLARDNEVVAPGYTRLDGSASYEVPGSRFTIGLIAQNFTNRRYVTSGAGGVFFAGPPRRLVAQLTSVF